MFPEKSIDASRVMLYKYFEKLSYIYFIYFLVQINNHQGKPLFMSQKDKHFHGFIFWQSVKLLFTVIIFKTDSKKELSKNIIEFLSSNQFRPTNVSLLSQQRYVIHRFII